MDEEERDEEEVNEAQESSVDVTPSFANYNWMFEASHVKSYVFRNYKEGMLATVMQAPKGWTPEQFMRRIGDMYAEWVWSKEDYVIRFLGLYPARYDEDGMRIFGDRDQERDRYEAMSEENKFELIQRRLALDFFSKMSDASDY